MLQAKLGHESKRPSVADMEKLLWKTRLYLKIENHGILLPKLFWPTVRKNCSSDREKLRDWRPRICKNFEITRKIYTKSERSDQFLQNAFLTCSWRFLRSNKLEQLNWDSQQDRSRKTSILLVAFWKFKLKVLKYPRNCRLHATVIQKVFKKSWIG